jgi:hypothetical protein
MTTTPLVTKAQLEGGLSRALEAKSRAERRAAEAELARSRMLLFRVRLAQRKRSTLEWNDEAPAD